MAKTSYHVCYHCKDRTVGCHASCKLYQDEKKERDEQGKQITNENIIGSTIHNLQKERYYNRNNRQRKVYKTHKR